MSLVYFLSKFSQEAILVELFLIGCLTTAYFGFLLTKKRKYGIAKGNIPDNVVRAFLIELLSHTEGFKNQLFGQNMKITASGDGYKIEPMIAGASGGASSADLDSLRAQLGASVSKQDELGKIIAALTAAKTDLESKLAAAAKAGTGTGGAPDKALTEKLSQLEAKLAEYEIIEDDLANLKRYQQENKQLREQLAALGGKPAEAVAAPAVAVAAPEPVAAAPAPVATPEPVAAAPVEAPAPVAEAAPAAPAADPIAAAEEAVAAADAGKSFEGMVDKIEESLTPAAAPVGASVQDPMAAAPAPAAAEAVAAPAADIFAAAEAPAAEAAAAPSKADADLLNEFERMLNS